MSASSKTKTQSTKSSAPEAAEKKNRLGINDDTIKHAEDVAKAALWALRKAAEMAQGVPYLSVISSALRTFIEIRDKVVIFKDECNRTMDGAEHIRDLIIGFRARCVERGRENQGVDVLTKALDELEAILFRCITTLQRCTSGDVKYKVWLIPDLERSVKLCAKDMQRAREDFSVKLDVEKHFLLEEILDGVIDLHKPPKPNAVLLPERLHAAPASFYGREEEVLHAVKLIHDCHDKSPAHVAIQGPGGIGKTSIALTILHNRTVQALYKECRYFVACEATVTARDIVGALAKAAGITLDGSSSAQSVVLRHLEHVKGVICLDNLETPWDGPDTARVEELLSELAALPFMALIITSRLMDTPRISWTSPPLKAPVMPFSLNAALQTWDDICGNHDAYAQRLVSAVECVPLAVTLLARVVRSGNSAMDIWDQWSSEYANKSSLLKTAGTAHRLNSLGASVELSLKAVKDGDATNLLRIISVLPYGLSTRYIKDWEKALGHALDVRNAVRLLKQFSLIYEEQASRASDKRPCLRILSPIRHYMLQTYPVSGCQSLFDRLASIYCDINHRVPADFDNAVTYLRMGFQSNALRERCLQTITHCDRDTCWIFYPTDLLLLAGDVARAHASPEERALYHRLSVMWSHEGNYAKARGAIRKAIELDKAAKRPEFRIDDLCSLAQLQADSAWIYTDPLDIPSRSKMLESAEATVEEARGLFRALPDHCERSYKEATKKKLEGLQALIKRRNKKLLKETATRTVSKESYDGPPRVSFSVRGQAGRQDSSARGPSARSAWSTPV